LRDIVPTENYLLIFGRAGEINYAKSSNILCRSVDCAVI
jgi:hypothetical protein